MDNAPSVLERLFSLDGKTVLITGASGGIGQTLAVALAEAGAAIGVHGRDTEWMQQRPVPRLRTLEEKPYR